jgi:hypothetical protein
VTPTTAQAAGVSLPGPIVNPIVQKALLRTGANAGTAQLQWAQQVSDAAGTIVKADSYLALTRVNLAGALTTYAEANVTTDRAFDANATTLDEVADVLGTLIADLRGRGLVV